MNVGDQNGLEAWRLLVRSEQARVRSEQDCGDAIYPAVRVLTRF